ncbi:MAG: helix-turn-helix transcriptional regulator [Candidatus Dojkabacteria bacterium]|nr:helix-turn-helix transcriptional regulator [Candidatus Dojkabacteria bacterium]
MGIGSKLSELLKERNMSASELARKIDVAPTTVYSIIQRNNKKVDIDVLLDMADVLGVDAEYFRDTPEQPITIAAHFDGTEYTKEQLERIKAFAAFIKSEGDK